MGNTDVQVRGKSLQKNLGKNPQKPGPRKKNPWKKCPQKFPQKKNLQKRPGQ